MRRAPIEAARAGLATDGGTSAAHGVGEAGVDGREDNGEEQQLASSANDGAVKCFVLIIGDGAHRGAPEIVELSRLEKRHWLVESWNALFNALRPIIRRQHIRHARKYCPHRSDACALPPLPLRPAHREMERSFRLQPGGHQPLCAPKVRLV